MLVNMQILLYIAGMTMQVVFLGSTQEDLQEWLDEGRGEAGHQLFLARPER
jgi:hypothetical protein